MQTTVYSLYYTILIISEICISILVSGSFGDNLHTFSRSVILNRETAGNGLSKFPVIIQHEYHDGWQVTNVDLFTSLSLWHLGNSQPHNIEAASL